MTLRGSMCWVLLVCASASGCRDYGAFELHDASADESASDLERFDGDMPPDMSRHVDSGTMCAVPDLGHLPPANGTFPDGTDKYTITATQVVAGVFQQGASPWAITLGSVQGATNIAYIDATSGKPGIPTTLSGSPVALVAADWNGDGILDIVVITSTGVFPLSAAGGQFVNGNPMPVGVPGVLALAVADFDEDTHPDIVGFTNIGGAFYSNVESGAAQPSTLFSTGAVAAIALDFDGDCHLDVVTLDLNGNLIIYAGNGHGSFASGQAPGLKQGTAIAPLYSASGKASLAAITNSQIMLVSAPNTISPFAGGSTDKWITLLTGDVNNDGTSDILAWNDKGAGGLWLDSGATMSTLAPGHVLSTPSLTDLNSDQKLDLVYLSNDTNNFVGIFVADQE